MKKITAMILTVLMVLSIRSVCFAEEVSVADAMSKETFTAADGTALPYRLYVPTDYQAEHEYSFLLFLHGAGNRGDNNEKQIAENTGLISRIINGETVVSDGATVDLSKEFIIIAPQCANDSQWVDTPWGKTPDPSYNLDEIPQSKYSTAVSELIASMQSTYHLNADRMYITGLSMGGFGTWDLLMRYPDLFAAAIPMGGAGDLSKADILKNIPIWTFHQMLDTVVSSQGTQKMVQKLTELGGDIRFTPYFDLQHNAWTKGYAEKDLLQWLYSHKKSDKIEIGTALNTASEAYKSELGLALAIGLLPQSATGHLQDSITRESFCESVAAMLPQTEISEQPMPFTDTKNPSVQKAYAFGIVNGVSDTQFNPTAAITKEELCTMLCRAAQKITPIEIVNEAAESFADLSAVADWARDGVALVADASILHADESGKLYPQESVSAEEAIAMVYRTYYYANAYGKVQ